MKTSALVAILAMVVGCGGGEGSFDSPEDTVKSFISAAADKDAEALSKCFASTCQGEFKSLVDKSASAEMLDVIRSQGKTT